MADRLTQLQDAVNQVSDFSIVHHFSRIFKEQADHFCNSVGVIQQCAPSSPFPGFERSGGKGSPPQQEDYALLFAKLIARTAKDIDVLIDSLPSEESSLELQLASLKKLEQENQEAARKLEDIVNHGERLLEQIQAALHDIAQSQLNCQARVSDPDS
ncbi:hypothetical protein LOTGIDRAFT_191328 [Lottia gigantea]|uniref:Mediator of RNA polymerase II transcription subunit 21 n=1 Tax=Lottia gigantea TaxID=225164 RepID=V4A4K0_LOTGI|nr:hypothetical protein LOTGIDRAFT_191328 [Lottia gigantea]ESO91637.1 hypothetical protein LOTGIDRAFT_191328 [Lottia gigantea]